VRRRLALLVLLSTLALAGAAAASWESGVYVGTLRNPGYGTRGKTSIRLLVTTTQVRVLSAQLSWRCSAKGRTPARIGPLRPMRIRVRPDTGGAQFSLNQTVGTTHVTIAGGITPGKPMQGLLDATRDTASGTCEDSALFTATAR